MAPYCGRVHPFFGCRFLLPICCFFKQQKQQPKT
jgi:hypothetical protein